ncbi:MAG: hypothetical protein DRP29_00610 [Thermodesulfobacteriota bacterium]|nr:MAG: hypothetical protein DRP29_00610 [Thermodesulfobacteriota bacterium]
MDLREAIKRAQKRLKDFALEEGNFIVGIYKGVKEVEVKGRKRILHRILNEEDGEEYGIWNTTVLQEELRRQNVKIGDRIAIKYCGKPEGKNYHDWIILKDMEEKNGAKNLSI